MNLFEKAQGPITVYHGSRDEISGDIRPPFFVTTHYEMARSYALHRQHGSGGQVTAFDLSPKAKICDVQTLDALATEHGVDHEGCHSSDLLAEESYREIILPALLENGYDAVFMHDFGYHCDFSEEPTYIVLNPKVLTNARVEEYLGID